MTKSMIFASFAVLVLVAPWFSRNTVVAASSVPVFDKTQRGCVDFYTTKDDSLGIESLCDLPLHVFYVFNSKSNGNGGKVLKKKGDRESLFVPTKNVPTLGGEPSLYVCPNGDYPVDGNNEFIAWQRNLTYRCRHWAK